MTALGLAAGQPEPSSDPEINGALLGVLTEEDWDELLLAWAPAAPSPETVAHPSIVRVGKRSSVKNPRSEQPAVEASTPTPGQRWSPNPLLTRACLEALVSNLQMGRREFVGEVLKRQPLSSIDDIFATRDALMRWSCLRESTHATMALFANPKGEADLAPIVAKLEEHFASIQPSRPTNLESKILKWFIYCIAPLRRMRPGDEPPCTLDASAGLMRLSDSQMKQMFTDYLATVNRQISHADAAASMKALVRPAKLPRLTDIVSVADISPWLKGTTPVPSEQPPTMSASSAPDFPHYGLSRSKKQLALRFMADDPRIARNALIAKMRAVYPFVESRKVGKFRENMNGHVMMVEWCHLFLQKQMDMIPAKLDQVIAATEIKFRDRRLAVPPTLGKRIEAWYEFCLVPLTRKTDKDPPPCASDGAGFFRLSIEQSAKLFNAFAI